MSVKEAALELLQEGFHPVILYPVGFVAWPGAEPKSGKEAIVRQWGQRPPFPEEIEELLDQYPGAGLGLCLGPGKGPGGRWLIDVEGDGPAAEESVAVLCDGEVVATRSWGSARGRHRLFYVDADRLRALVANQGTVLKDPPGLPDLELRFGGAGKQLQSAYPPTLTTLYGSDGPPLPGPPRRWLETGPIAALPEAAYAVLERLLPRSGHIEHQIDLVRTPRASWSGLTGPVRPRTGRPRCKVNAIRLPVPSRASVMRRCARRPCGWPAWSMAAR